MAGIIVRPRARILHGHDWVYGSEVLKTYGSPEPGAEVAVKDGRDRLLGTAIYNPHSQIVARRFSRRKETLDTDFFARRVARAAELRARIGCDPAAHRIVWSEADGLPGVIADRYGQTVVLQTATLAMDARKALIAEALAGLPGVASVIERDDSAARKAEGLDPASGTLLGPDPAPCTCTLGGARFEVDFLGGHKTGLYLDQAENYARVAALARGASVLDVFSNVGGFALACAAAGAREVAAVESGAETVARLRRNAALNSAEIEIRQADAFSDLAALARSGRTFDLVILDPPSFTRAKGKINDALRGYRELHRLAAPLVAPDGHIATFSCSHHISAESFREVVSEGLAEGRRSARIAGSFAQSADHPAILHLPETFYLKGLLLQMRAAF